MTALEIVRKRDVPELLGISRSTLANWLNPKSEYFRQDFPEQIRLSARLAGFRVHDLERWLADGADGRKSTASKTQAIRDAAGKVAENVDDKF